ncbi:MAG: hypothetical protein KatS3mg031_0555 [Chitinophagales bacterium]|nr:MAG: hypothetical protein KatS3mg031_0555 [Chitinophagales bacterium]
MKNLFLSFTILASATLLAAQCVVDSSNTTDGFTPASLPCITQGSPYSEVVQLHIPTSFGGATIDSVLLLSITGLPTGIGYAINPSPAAIPGGSNGCILFSGTTAAAVGTYPLDFLVRVWVNVGVPVTIDTSLSAFGFTYSLQVCAPQASACDTLSNITATDTLTLYTFASGGYLSGNNNFGDMAKAEKFGAAAGDKVTGAFFYFAVATSPVPTRTVTFTVWSDNGPGGSPGTVLASSSVAFSDIITSVQNDELLYVAFPTEPVLPNDSFFVGVQLPTAAGDTVALWTTTGSGPLGNGWEQWSGGTWYSYAYAYSAPIGNVILPVVCAPANPPVADFTASPRSGCGTVNVQFTDLSLNSPTQWNWSFPGGVPSSSTDQNPVVSYSVPGVYSVTLQVSNATGSDTLTQTNYITVYPQLTVSLSKTDAGCAAANGTITSSVSGGTPPFQYFWSHGSTMPDPINLTPGLYTVTVVDVNGCSDTASIVINNSSGLTASITATVSPNCGQANGSATVTPSGGTPPYSYAWNTVPPQYTQTASNMTDGNYSVTVTDSAGCSAIASVTLTCIPLGGAGCDTLSNITATDSLTLYTFVSPNSGYLSGNNSYGDWAKAEKFGATAGDKITGALFYFAVATSSVPTRTVTFRVWSDSGPGGSPGTVLASNTVTFSTIIASVQNDELLYVPFPSEPVLPSDSFFVGVVLPTAAGDTVALWTTTGSGPFGNGWEQWSGGTWYSYVDAYGAPIANVILPVVCEQPVAPVADFSAVPQTGCGSVSVQFTDLSTNNPTQWNWIFPGGSPSVSTSQNPVVTYNTSGSYNVTLIVTNAGGSDTLSRTNYITVHPAVNVTVSKTDATCTASDGTVTAMVTSGGGGYTYLWNTGSTSASLNGLPPSTYTVTVTDANGCTATASAVVVASSGSLTASVTSLTNADCGVANGSATVTAFGGTTPHTYTWNTTPVQNTPTASNLLAGIYSVTITDAGGCSVTLSVTIGNVNGPTIAVQSQTNVSCSGGADGSVTVSASGGNAPYTYSLDGTNFQISPTFSGLSAGNYTITVKDVNACVASVNVTLTQPSPIVISINKTDVSCFGGNNGTATANVSGGTPPYVYQWSNSQSGVFATNLRAGTYSLVVTDGSGCTASASVTVNQPMALNPQVSVTSVSCFGGNDGGAAATATGGTPPYLYAWGNGQSGTGITGLTAGSYVVTVTDANGCTATTSAIVSQPAAALVVHATASNITCRNANDGAITLLVSGGTAPYSYTWSNGSSAKDQNNLSAGNYGVTVTDAKGCTATASAVITEPDALTLTTSSTPASSASAQDGTASVTPSGGTPPYSYQWNTSPVQTTPTASGLAPGNYSVTVTDSNGCIAFASVAVTVITAIHQPALQASITLFPNPVADRLFIEAQWPETGSLYIELVDLTGMVVLGNAFAGTKHISTSLQVGALAPGVYFLRVIGTNTSLVQKVIIAR